MLMQFFFLEKQRNRKNAFVTYQTVISQWNFELANVNMKRNKGRHVAKSLEDTQSIIANINLSVNLMLCSCRPSYIYLNQSKIYFRTN